MFEHGARFGEADVFWIVDQSLSRMGGLLFRFCAVARAMPYPFFSRHAFLLFFFSFFFYVFESFLAPIISNAMKARTHQNDLNAVAAVFHFSGTPSAVSTEFVLISTPRIDRGTHCYF